MNKAFIIATLLFFCLVKSIFFFYTTCRNILTLTNNLELPDREMTLENYDEWIEKLNVTYPDEIAQLQPCDLEKFLSEVILEHSTISLNQIHFYFYIIVFPRSFFPHSLHLGRVWLLSHSLKRSRRCQPHRCGLYCSSSCSLLWVSPPCLAIWRES